ncbi:Uncharacterised protein [Bordetella pertussis]|nr:Uncharacterised protein [Bordetella pertussis]
MKSRKSPNACRTGTPSRSTSAWVMPVRREMNGSTLPSVRTTWVNSRSICPHALTRTAANSRISHVATDSPVVSRSATTNGPSSARKPSRAALARPAAAPARRVCP